MTDWANSEPAQVAMGDNGRWTRTLPTLWQGVAFPDGPWQPPDAPRGGRGGDLDAFDYWNPLLHLICGALGWGDPAAGAQAWVDAGMPETDPATRVLKKWWADDVLVLVEWDRQEMKPASMLGEQVTSALPGTVRPSRRSSRTGPPVRHVPAHWSAMLDGGWDPLHLTRHVIPLLADSSDEFPERSHARLLLDEGGQQGALLLSSYKQWLGLLHKHGPPGIPIDIIVKPLGWFGTFQYSPVTRRWHACSHEIHLMGWPEAGPA